MGENDFLHYYLHPSLMAVFALSVSDFGVTTSNFGTLINYIEWYRLKLVRNINSRDCIIVKINYRVGGFRNCGPALNERLFVIDRIVALKGSVYTCTYIYMNIYLL